MFQGILDKIIDDAEKLFVDINKNNSDMDDILLNDLYNFHNITIDKIDNFKNNHIENMDIFLNYHSITSIVDINNTTYEQLNDILNDNNLQLLKIKRLMRADIQEYLINTEKDIVNKIKDILNELGMINKLEFYYEIYKNNNVKEYFQMIQNYNNSEDIFLSSNTEFINITNEDFDLFINSVLEDKNISFKKIEIDNMHWDNNVFLYKFYNKKTYEYTYIYFDIFTRKDKTESKNIIKLKSNIYCINEYNKNLSNVNINKLYNSISKIIKQ